MWLHLHRALACAWKKVAGASTSLIQSILDSCLAMVYCREDKLRSLSFNSLCGGGLMVCQSSVISDGFQALQDFPGNCQLQPYLANQTVASAL
jgi:hypothetical protein